MRQAHHHGPVKRRLQHRVILVGAHAVPVQGLEVVAEIELRLGPAAISSAVDLRIGDAPVALQVLNQDLAITD